jgi:hypothetical protein
MARDLQTCRARRLGRPCNYRLPDPGRGGRAVRHSWMAELETFFSAELHLRAAPNRGWNNIVSVRGGVFPKRDDPGTL